MRNLVLLFALLTLPVSAAAKDSLGVYSGWAVFRDKDAPRCYAIAKSGGTKSKGAYATIATWPRKKVRNQVHFQLSRTPAKNSRTRVRIGNTNFDLAVRGRNAWAKDRQTNAALIAALRSATTMRVRNAAFSDRYDLTGVATAIDAAVVSCAQL